MPRFLALMMRSMPLRLLLVGLIVAFPAGISTAWLGAAYQRLIWGVDFTGAVLGMTIAGYPPVFLSGMALIYPLERWLIRDRAVRDWRWVLLRILLYTIVGIPIGVAFLWGMRLGFQSFPPLVESSYYVTAVANVGVFGLLYSFIERTLAEMDRREAQLKQQIEQLRIEVDEVKRARRVQEITETDYFRQLQARAQELRERR